MSSLMKIRPVDSRVVAYGWTDGRTDGQMDRQVWRSC